VADVEFKGEYTTFDALCKAVADSSWAKSLSLDAWTLGALMIQHDTIVTMDKPESMPETETPAIAAIPPVPTIPHNPPQSTTSVEIKTYDDGGRGKKQCPACKKYIGARNAICACGHEFSKAPATQPVQPKSVGAAAAPVRRVQEAEQPQEYTPGRHVLCTVRGRTEVPAGACPIKLTGTDIQTVEEWAEKVRIYCQRERSQWMMLSALKYYAREFYDIFGPDYAEISKNLEVIYAVDSTRTFQEEEYD